MSANVSGSEASQAAAAAILAQAIAVAPQLASPFKFGTSSWTFEGWKGLVYHADYRARGAFSRAALAEYAACPMFRAVGVDSTYYRPPTRALLDRYYAQAPSLQFTVKTWQEITSQRYPEKFLNPKVFSEAAVRAFAESKLAQNGSMLLLQFSKLPEHVICSGEFLERLLSMLDVAQGISVAVEVRNLSLLSSDYISALNARGIHHVFSWSTEMPHLVEQLKAVAAAGGITSNRYVMRALIPPGFNYEATKANYAPFNTIQRPSPALHVDVQRIIQRALTNQKEVTVLFNNKAEGSAPLSVAHAILAATSSRTGGSRTS